MNKNELLCTVCKQQKNKLHARKSRLWPAVDLFLCGDCNDAKREPRFVIILAGRTNGIDSIKDYINKHRYVGKPIEVSELL